jgi:hypothetical protein
MNLKNCCIWLVESFEWYRICWFHRRNDRSLLAEPLLLSQLSSLNFITIKYTHSTTYAVVTMRNVQRKSSFGQTGIGHTYVHLCTYIHGSQAEIQTPTSSATTKITPPPPTRSMCCYVSVDGELRCLNGDKQFVCSKENFCVLFKSIISSFKFFKVH